MSILEALILGIIQGLTEFLPVSSSGHIELGKAILNVEAKEDITFSVVVHGATVLSTIVIFYKYIWQLLKDGFKFQWNESTQYLFKIGLSMIPVVIVGLFFKDDLEHLFNGNVLLVGFMLLITGALLTFTYYSKNHVKEISWASALIIGLAQAVAVLPGISRSGSTIATGLLLGVKKETVTKFSFLMVLVPIIGANVLDMKDGDLFVDRSKVVVRGEVLDKDGQPVENAKVMVAYKDYQSSGLTDDDGEFKLLVDSANHIGFLMVYPPDQTKATFEQEIKLAPTSIYQASVNLGKANDQFNITNSKMSDPVSLLVGFIAAFLSGLLACQLMIKIVERGKLIWFALYCFVVGLVAIGSMWF